MRHIHWGHILITALAPIIWGTTYFVTTELLPEGRPFTAAFIRTFPAGLLLLAWARFMPSKDQFFKLFILGALNIGIFQTLLFISAYRLPGGIAAIMGGLQPLFLLLLLWGVEKQTPLLKTVFAAISSILGMMLIFTPSDLALDPIGLWAAFFGTVTVALGTFLSQRWIKGLPVFAVTGWQLLLGGALIAPMMAFYDPPLQDLTFQNFLGYGYLITIGAVLSYSLWFYGVSRLHGAAASSLTVLSPLTALFIGWVFLGESLTLPQISGVAIVLTALLFLQKQLARRKHVPLTTQSGEVGEHA